MPAGTIYHEWEPCVFHAMNIKGETILHGDKPVDWWSVHVPSVGGLVEMMDTGFEDSKASMPVDLECPGRDALFDDKLRYAVWEEADVRAFAARLAECAKVFGVAVAPQ